MCARRQARSNRRTFWPRQSASIQTNSFVRRVSWIFDCVVLVIVVALSGPLQRFSRIDLVLGAIAFSAAYAMLALTLFSRWNIWLPGFLPLGAVWSVVVFSLLMQKPKNSARTAAVAPPPPVPPRKLHNQSSTAPNDALADSKIGVSKFLWMLELGIWCLSQSCLKNLPSNASTGFHANGLVDFHFDFADGPARVAGSEECPRNRFSAGTRGRRHRRSGRRHLPRRSLFVGKR